MRIAHACFRSVAKAVHGIQRAYRGIQWDTDYRGAAGNYPSRLGPLGLGSFLLPGRDHGAIVRV